jgi:hypothetical protein
MFDPWISIFVKESPSLVDKQVEYFSNFLVQTTIGVNDQRRVVVERAEADRTELEQVFGDLGQILSAEGPRSDLHNHFEAVFLFGSQIA